MTEIVFFRTKSGWRGFEALGHTGYGKHGEDVVCAAISALTQAAVLGLEKVLGINCLVGKNEKSGLLACLLPSGLSREKWEKAQLILDVLYTGLLDITNNEQYQKYISLGEVPYREHRFTAFRHQKRRRKQPQWQRFRFQTPRRKKP